MAKGRLGRMSRLLFLIGLGFIACRSTTPPVEFYTLAPLAEGVEATREATAGEQIAVGVGPLELPKVLNRPQIVSRPARNKLHLAEFHRWGGPLQDEFLQVLTENLAILLGSNRVVAYPWEEYFKPRFRIFLQVHQFDGKLGENVVLNVTWTVTGPESRNVLCMQRSILKETASGMDYESFVSAENRALAGLSREIAREITILQLDYKK
jgi:uncharacterized lipoprotein YmbA